MRPIVSRDDRRTTRRTDAERLGERQERVVPWGLSGTCTQAQRGSHRDKQVRISPCANHICRVARPGSVRNAILGRTIEAGRAIGAAKSATEVARNLGHVDTRMVEKHYGHLSPSFITEA